MEKNLIIDIKILKYDSSLNHPEKEYDISLSIMKHKIKDGIEKKFNSLCVLIERFKNIETKLIDTKCDRNNTINLWFDCLTDLNNII
ncbi:hypothetical protein H8356DRAFT_1377616 [Neocallimastix lanati (nom. inval.)]|nr:hypothetical protein H8356DRAFT_1377616 [Neocallimastix sp. JGI-2020a]